MINSWEITVHVFFQTKWQKMMGRWGTYDYQGVFKLAAAGEVAPGVGTLWPECLLPGRKEEKCTHFLSTQKTHTLSQEKWPCEGLSGDVIFRDSVSLDYSGDGRPVQKYGKLRRAKRYKPNSEIQQRWPPPLLQRSAIVTSFSQQTLYSHLIMCQISWIVWALETLPSCIHMVALWQTQFSHADDLRCVHFFNSYIYIYLYTPKSMVLPFLCTCVCLPVFSFTVIFFCWCWCFSLSPLFLF